MRPPRLHHPGPLRGAGAELELPEAARRHLRVLRLRPGAELRLFDGQGGEWRARLLAQGRARLLEHLPVERESPLAVELAQALARGERMDWALQKAVELGVAALAPVATARCGLRLEGERAARRLRHWRAVVAAACEQCGRNRLPPVAPPRPLAAWLAELGGPGPGELRLALSPGAGAALGELPRPTGPVRLLVGPEGGLAPEELAAARAAGFRPLALGPRVLRTETAGPAALAALQALWGDLGG